MDQVYNQIALFLDPQAVTFLYTSNGIYYADVLLPSSGLDLTLKFYEIPTEGIYKRALIKAIKSLQAC